jgi:hypothetical protein
MLFYIISNLNACESISTYSVSAVVTIHDYESQRREDIAEVVEYLTQGRSYTSIMPLEAALEKIPEGMLDHVAYAVKEITAHRPDDGLYPLIMAFRHDVFPENIDAIVLATCRLLEGRPNHSSFETVKAVKAVPTQELSEYVETVLAIAKTYPDLFVRARDELIEIKATHRISFATRMLRHVKSAVVRTFDQELQNAIKEYEGVPSDMEIEEDF